MFLKEPIVGRVARIVDEYTLALNIGSDDGVTASHFFAVVADEPETIVNPDNGEPIGEIPRIKLKLKVVDIFPAMTLAGTYETYTTGGGLNTGLGDMFGPRVERLERIKTDEPLIAAESMKIAVGDKVIQIEDD